MNTTNKTPEEILHIERNLQRMSGLYVCLQVSGKVTGRITGVLQKDNIFQNWRLVFGGYGELHFYAQDVDEADPETLEIFVNHRRGN